MEQPKVYSYIRFSTPEQARGTSLQRQNQCIKKVSEKYNIPIDESLTFRDLGISGYKGKHRKAALGNFLALCEDGTIARGSILVIESFDRLSREQIQEAAHLMYEITKHGIMIITACDDKQYTHESDLGDYIYAIIVMSRAHEESKMKSLRLKEARRIKREQMRKDPGKVIYTKTCPAWLSPRSDGKGFDVIEDRGEIIRRIFEMKLAGMGCTLIAKTLNKEKVSWMPEKHWKNPPRVAYGWQESYIKKILDYRSVLGEFQPYPYRKKRGEEIPEGDPIQGYFPRVISEDLFYSVQAQTKENFHRGGRNGKKCANLFAYIAKCSICGSPMTFVDKGKPPKGRHFLICDTYRRGLGCERHYVKYADFERLILTYCKGLDIKKILPDSDQQQSKMNLLYTEINALKGKVHNLQKKKKNILTMMEDNEDPRAVEVLKARFSDIIREIDKAEKDEKIFLDQINKQETIETSYKKKLESVTDLYELMDKKSDEELFLLRLSLRAEIRKLIESINCGERTYEIHFRSGVIRTIEPDLPKGLIYEIDKEQDTATLFYPGESFLPAGGDLREVRVKIDKENFGKKIFQDPYGRVVEITIR